MEIIQDYWWVWLIGFVLSAAFAIVHERNIKSRADFLQEERCFWKIFLCLIPGWVFGTLFLFTAIAHVFDSAVRAAR